jgi:hypothetical protein
VEVCHLEPVGLILDTDITQLNEHLGGFDVIATVPLERRAQCRFNLCLVRVQAIEGVLVFLLITSTKYDLHPRCIIICYATQVKPANTEEAIDPIIPRWIHIGEGTIFVVRLLNVRKRIRPVFPPELVTAARLINICLILVTQIKRQVCWIFIIQLEQVAQDGQFALCAGVSPHIDSITNFQ